MKKIFVLLGFLFLTSCTSSLKNDGVINIVTTTNPNQNLVKYIAQDKVNIQSIQFDSDSHNFEVKPNDIKNIEEASVIFYNGLGLDDKVLDFSKEKDKFVRTTEGAELIEISEKDHDHHEEKDHHDKDKDEHKYYDPHVWLSLKEYKVMGKNVLDKLVEIDPKNESFYNKNYNDFIVRADSIYNSYIGDFKILNHREFISNHGSYGYLARDYGLVNNSLHDVNNHGEVNPQNIQSIIDIVLNKNIKLIIGDQYESNKELEVISNETGINYKVVNNLESKGDFFTEYEKLLSSIYDGLK